MSRESPMNTRDQQPGRAAPRKRPYHTPRLIRYGTLGEITRGGGGAAREPGGQNAPKSKASGGQ